MHDDIPSAITAYVDAAAALMEMPLSAERRVPVATNMRRIASFAANLTAVELADDVEIAGEFVP